MYIFQTVWILIYGFEIIEKHDRREEHEMNENTILSLYTKRRGGNTLALVMFSFLAS